MHVRFSVHTPRQLIPSESRRMNLDNDIAVLVADIAGLPRALCERNVVFLQLGQHSSAVTKSALLSSICFTLARHRENLRSLLVKKEVMRFTSRPRTSTGIYQARISGITRTGPNLRPGRFTKWR